MSERTSPYIIAAVAIPTALLSTYYLIARRRPRGIPNSADRCKESYPDITSREISINSERDPGRVISWSEYGPHDGRPVFYLHGLPGSRIIPVPQLKELCHRVRVRLIALDRPGIGKTSAPSPSSPSHFHAASHDLAEVIHHLDISPPIHIIGYSMGAPHALAFLALANSSSAGPKGPRLAEIRVGKVDLIAPAGFTSAPQSLTGVCIQNRMGHFGARHFPSILRWGWTAAAGVITAGTGYIDDMMNITTPEESAYLEKEIEETRRLWRITGTESWRQGIGAFLQSVLETFGKDAPDGWNFFNRLGDGKGYDLSTMDGLGDVQVAFWHGQKDLVTPLPASLELSALLEKAGGKVKVNELGPENGHFAIVPTVLRRILEGRS